MRSANKKTGEPIKGSLLPYKGSDIERVFFLIKDSGGKIIPNLLVQLRELMKDSTAFLFRDALQNVNRYTPIPNSVQTYIYREINKFSDQDVASFVDCTILYYNQQRASQITLYNEGNPYNAREVGKAIAQARAHVQKADKVYIRDIIKMLEEGYWENFTPFDNTRWLQKYNAISRAIDFVCNYFLQYYKNGLPNKLTESVYKSALTYDAKLSNLYTRTSYGFYQRNKGINTSFNTIGQECAACIISQTYFLKNAQ